MRELNDGIFDGINDGINDATIKFVNMVEGLEKQKKDLHVLAVRNYGKNLLKQYKSIDKSTTSYVRNKVNFMTMYIDTKQLEK